jgi:ATP-binding cassette, subfamily C, bacteriocin exporter
MNQTNLQKIKETFQKSEDHIQAGLACLASVINYYGGNVPLQKLYKAGGASQEKVTLLGLSKAASAFDFEADGYKGDADYLKKLDQPVILHIEKVSGLKDFIVLYGYYNNKFIVGDPQWGIVEYREDELEAFWKSKTFLIIKPGENFKTEKDKTNLKKNNLKSLLIDHKSLIFTITGIGIFAAAILIIILPVVLNFLESMLNGQPESIEAKSILPLLLVLAVVLGTCSINKALIRQGSKSILSGLNKKILETSFYRNNNPVTTGNLKTVLNSARYFGIGTFQLFGTMPFLIPIILASLIYISTISIITGIILIFSVTLSCLLAWWQKKEYSQLLLQEYHFQILEMETIKESVDAAEKSRLTNSENLLISSNGNILDLSEDIQMKISSKENEANNRFYFIFFLSICSVIALNFFIVKLFVNYQGLTVAAWGIIFFWVVKEMFESFIVLIKTSVSYNFLYENLWEHEPVIKNFDDNESGKDLEKIKKFSVEELSVSFPGRLPVVKAVNFEAVVGNLTGVYGPSGGGKSVLVSTLCRQLSITSGGIKINGIDWKSLNDYQWRKIVSSTRQPSDLFNANILQNIGWGKLNVEPEEIISFCEKLGLNRFIERFPNRYSSTIKEISNSEAQLIALASAIYSKPQILLLDEPLLGMDQMYEDFCWKLIQQIKSEMIILVFTSRKEIVKKADHVFMLENEKAVIAT